ncbi:hypothetical protein [Pedobacter panaciterrae]
MKRSSITISLLVKFSQVFPDQEADVTQLLGKYGRKLILQMVAVLNSMLQREIKELPRQIQSWFGAEDPQGEYIMKLIFRGYREAINRGEKLHIINDHSNLRLNQIALGFSEIDENTIISTREAHLDLFKAYLLLNEEYLIKQENITNTIPQEMTGIAKATWMSTATLVSYYDFGYYSQGTFLCQVIKAYYCFQFIEAYKPELFQRYLTSLNIASFQDYAKKILPLAQLCFTDTVSFNAQSDEDKAYLELYASSNVIEENDNNSSDFDFLQIRNKPLFQFSENQFLLLNRAMIINKIYTAIYWDIKAILADSPALQISQNKFRIDYTSDYSEGFLVYKILQKAYGRKSCKQYSGAQMKEFMVHSEPDYYIRNGNKIFLYEVKDSFLAGTVKQSFNVADIQTDLINKYYKSGNSEKAVQQLITRIAFSLRKEYPFDNQYEVKNLSVYPIIVVYDINLTVPGIERQLVRWFTNEKEILVAELADEGITGFKINDLVVLHIDGLIKLSDYINANKLKMEDLIDGFNKRTHKLLSEFEGKTFEQIRQNVLASLLSFEHYVGDCLNAIPAHQRVSPFEIKYMDQH